MLAVAEARGETAIRKERAALVEVVMAPTATVKMEQTVWAVAEVQADPRAVLEEMVSLL
jgi:hypothetical protein